MAGAEWARLQTDVKCRLRRGAWYRVLRLGALEATLDVHGHPQTVARSALELSAAPPSRWSVVPYARRAAGVPDAGAVYAVCPGCRSRASMVDRPATLRCPRCNGLFEIAWDESRAGPLRMPDVTHRPAR